MLDAMVLVCEDSTSPEGGDLDAAELARHTGCVSSTWVVRLTYFCHDMRTVLGLDRPENDLQMVILTSYQHFTTV